MLARAWPANPKFGQLAHGYVYNGREWTRTRMSTWSNVIVFPVGNHRYAPTSEDVIYVVVECIGAGGGGGWATRGLNVLTGNAGAGGGGSGGYSRKTIPAELLIQGVDVVVAAGLIVGLSQTGWQYAPDTSFGGLCIAKGGQNAMPYDGLGVTGVVPSFGQCGLGAPIGTGDVAMPGATGHMWHTMTSWQISDVATYIANGVGGAGPFGGNSFPTLAWNPNSNVNGSSGAFGTGAGGTGGICASASTVIGGQGGSGLVIVTEHAGTESGGGGGGGEGPDPGPGQPPGVPLNLIIKAAVTNIPYDPGDCAPEPKR